MKKNFNKDKLLTIGILPVMWFIYLLFEIVTGRVTNLYSLILNTSLIIIFAIVGYIIYILGKRYSNGFTSKNIFTIFSILMIIDQGIKLVIKSFFFNEYFEIIPSFLSFDPIINTQGSWLNARFNFGVNFSFLIIINILALILFLELYRYYLYKGNKDFWADLCFLFILAGAFCSLIDKVFYGGSLDFIGISDLFIADIKDIYINLGILFFIMTIYKNGYLDDTDDSTIKDDIKSIKDFITFAIKDIFRK